MKNLGIRAVKILLTGFILIATGCTKNPEVLLRTEDFKNPPANVSLHTWWHWLDGNISREGITADLEAMKEQGIIQATVLNIGLLGDRDFGVKKVIFNSPEWFEMFHWALQEANRLGISIGVHNCDGWSTSGGPWITPEMSMKQYVWTKTIVHGAQPGTIKLKQPLATRDYYKDVAVVAIKSNNSLNSFQKASPSVVLNDSANADHIFDGCPASALFVDNSDKITFRFNEAFTADKIAVLPRKAFMWSNPEEFTSTYSLSASDDGRNFKQIAKFTIKGLNRTVTIPFKHTAAKWFQLALIENNNLDGWLPLTIAECELLSQDESPLYAPEIINLSEKTGDIKSISENDFYSRPEGKIHASAKDVIDLTSKLGSDGTLDWKPSEGNWTIIRFGYTTTGSVNSPATEAGMGLECDKMDTAALNLHFKSFPAKLIEKAGPFTGNTFKFMLIDSWECGFQNWTKNMFSEFEHRRGYSLADYIPVLCGESSGDTETDEAVLFDFRKTIAELIENNYYRHFGELLHQNNLEYHAEIIYGNTNYPPLDILRTTQYVDLPMFEFWSSTDEVRNVKYRPAEGIELNMPSVAATGYGKKVVGSEAYTGYAHYGETPENLKSFGDRAYCAGINQMILHSYVHQPNNNRPGLTLGPFGSSFNRNNSAWPFISSWFNFQSRIQYILQQGIVSHDVLYYLGDQLPQFLTYNKSNTLPFGYMFNACNFDILQNRIRVEDGKLVLNGNATYSILCLPPHESMNLETLKRIEELVKDGVVLYAPKPLHLLSLKEIKNGKKEFEESVARLWGNIDGSAVTSNTYGKGRVYWGIPIGEVLNIEKILPDINTRQNDNTNLMFIHKKAGGDDVYFLMNQQNDTLSRNISFRVTGKTPEIWDPETGNMKILSDFTTDDDYTTITVNLKPNQSLFVVFSDEKSTGQVNKTSKRSTVTTTFVVSAISGKLTFDAAYPAVIEPVEINSLQWLTEYENPDIRYFAGTATYAINFEYPVENIKEGDSVLLDLGEFETNAEVSLNGSPRERLWKPGILIPVNEYLKQENLLEISIVNPFRNRIIGDLKQYGKLQHVITSVNITDFLNKDFPVIPSGLKGPLKIVTIKATDTKLVH